MASSSPFVYFLYCNLCCLRPYPGMTEKVSYPPSYLLAFYNRLSTEQLADPLMREPAPFFVYGALQLPELLIKYFNFQGSREIEEMEMAQLMTPGRLAKHKVHVAYGTTYPAMVATGNAEDIVSGMLVFGASENQRQVSERDGADCYRVAPVRVCLDLSSGETINVTALTYIWKRKELELFDTSDILWTLEGYLLSREKYPNAPAKLGQNLLDDPSTSSTPKFSALKYALAHNGEVELDEDEEDEDGFVSYTLKEFYS